MCPLFIRMLSVIRIMLICSLFIRVNMLRTHLKLNFIFGKKPNEYNGRCVLVYLPEGKNHERQLLQGVLNNSDKQLLQGVQNKRCQSKQIYRRQPRRR